jgi:hypothetical protein
MFQQSNGRVIMTIDTAEVCTTSVANTDLNEVFLENTCESLIQNAACESTDREYACISSIWHSLIRGI